MNYIHYINQMIMRIRLYDTRLLASSAVELRLEVLTINFLVGWLILFFLTVGGIDGLGFALPISAATFDRANCIFMGLDALAETDE